MRERVLFIGVMAPRITFSIFLITITIIIGSVMHVAAEMASRGSPFGADTITLDTETGLKWLDVTLSTPYSYDEILIEMEPGGVFDGYRLATQDEILTFWQNAGIDTSALGSFVPENFQPITDLLALVGTTYLGGGNYWDFTVGHIESGPGGGWVYSAGIAIDPDTDTGRASFGTVPSSNENEHHGSWLIAKPITFMPGIPILLLEE